VRALLVIQLLSATSNPHPAGPWKGALDLAGGGLPFDLRITGTGVALRGELCNGPSCQPFSAVRLEGDSLVLEMADYAAVLKAAIEGDSLKGYYHNIGSRGPRTIPFRAERGQRPLSRAPAQLIGSWDATYFEELGTSPRVFVFQNGPRGIEGRIISSTSDYGPFVGAVAGDSFAVGLFDGSFVYLLTGKLAGDTLRGIFHAGLKTQTRWVAVRSSGAAHLRSPTEISTADTTEPLRFAFPDLEGHLVRSDDRRFQDKVVLLEILGTWCPTCHDATPGLLRLYHRYHQRGLEIVGLGFEATGDTAADAAQLRRFRSKFRIPFPILLAGVNDNQSIEEALLQLHDVTAFPTTVFLGRDGRVRRIYAGFHGVGAREQHGRMVREFEAEIVRLLNESASR
jgi:thiol-disulfide isomerase/thioredoxin